MAKYKAQPYKRDLRFANWARIASRSKSTISKMIKRLELSIDDHSFLPGKWIGGHAIRVNIIKRLKKLEITHYKKFEIILSNGLPENSYIEYEDKNNIRVFALNRFDTIINCTDIQNVRLIYTMIFESLSVIWEKKEWDENSLIKIHGEIVKENYVVISAYGKPSLSLNKKLKAEIYCQLFPEYAEFYLRINEKNKQKREILFFKGYLDPAFFLSFFNSLNWKENEYAVLSDYNKRVFFIFSAVDGSFQVEYSSVHSSIQENENFLKAFQFDTPDSNRSLLLGIPSA